MAPRHTRLTDTSTASSGLTGRELVAEYELACEAQGLSPATRTFYHDAARQLLGFLGDEDLDPDEITPEQLSAFFAHRRRTVSPASARSRYNALRPWFGWMARRGYLTADPFLQGLARPRAPQAVMPIPSSDAVEALLASLEARDYLSLRDRALILLLADTGLRRSEVAALRVADLDLTHGVLRVVAGKGGK